MIQVTERRFGVRLTVANRADSPGRNAKPWWRAITLARSIVTAVPSSQTTCSAVAPTAETACKVRVDWGSSINHLRGMADKRETARAARGQCEPSRP
jgi:hypothetical protein